MAHFFPDGKKKQNIYLFRPPKKPRFVFFLTEFVGKN